MSPAAGSASPAPDPAALRVALDATPLLGHPTGVGAFCAGALAGLSARSDVVASAYAVSWRRRHGIDAQLPAGVAAAGRPMPARPLHWAWGRTGHPTLEWFVGRTDVVHGTNFVVPPTRRAARVATVHDLTTVRYPELCTAATLAFPDLVRRAIGGGAFIHTPSSYVAAEVVEAFGADPARVVAVHSGVPPLPPPDTRAAARLVPAGTSRYVLAVGTAEPRKDLPSLVAAFDLVAAERPDLALVLCGPAGWGSAALDRAVASSPFAERVVRSGWVDDATLSGLVHAAAVLAYPSRYEGFGFPPLQAMAAGVPVVATRAGALPEVLGEAATLVDVGDPTALAAGVAALLDTAAAHQAAVVRGRRRAEGYSWDRCAEGLCALYRTAALTGTGA